MHGYNMVEAQIYYPRHIYMVEARVPYTLLVECSRVESGSDDPDYLGHLGYFFGRSSGSHPQTNLSGCDPDF